MENKKSPGRPLKYNEPLISVTFRIPASKVQKAKELIAKLKAT